MFGGEGGDARPNSEDERCGRGDCAQNDVVLRNVEGGKEGSGSVITTVTEAPPYIDSSRQEPLTLVIHNSSHAVLCLITSRT